MVWQVTQAAEQQLVPCTAGPASQVGALQILCEVAQSTAKPPAVATPSNTAE